MTSQDAVSYCIFFYDNYHFLVLQNSSTFGVCKKETNLQ
ncbi:hypothetical protein [Chryseobacterium sp. MYb264]